MVTKHILALKNDKTNEKKKTKLEDGSRRLLLICQIKGAKGNPLFKNTESMRTNNTKRKNCSERIFSCEMKSLNLFIR